jgi:beta-xylosidase
MSATLEFHKSFPRNLAANSQLTASNITNAHLVAFRAWIATGLALVAGTAWSIGAATPALGAPPSVSVSVVGPVYSGDAPDPSVLTVGHTYYAYTTNSGVNSVPVLASDDLVHWRLVGDAMPVAATWASTGFSWSPSVSTTPSGGYQLFYDAFDAANGDQCIGRATSTTPLGPFVDSSTTPFLCQESLGGSIDASVFQSRGADVLVWKSDHKAGIWAQSLGTDDASLLGTAHLLLSPSASWEDGIVEGPALAEIGGALTLWFSAGQWSGSGYSIGMAMCSSPLGPCQADTVTQELSTGSSLTGPGGPTFFDANGRLMLAFAAWDEGARALYLGHLTVNGRAVMTGWPTRNSTAPAKGRDTDVDDRRGGTR